MPVLAHSSRCGRAPALAARWKRAEASSSPIGLVGALGDRDAEPVAQLARDLAADRHVPAADEQRGDRSDGRVQPRLDAPLDAAQVGFGRRQVLLPREKQRDVDRDAGEDRRLDGGQSFRACRGS